MRLHVYPILLLPMKTQSKQIFQFVIIVIVSSLMIIASIRMFKKDMGLDLNNTTRIEGTITKSFDTLHSSGGKLKQLPVFAFKLNTLDQTLGAYRPSHDY